MIAGDCRGHAAAAAAAAAAADVGERCRMTLQQRQGSERRGHEEARTWSLVIGRLDSSLALSCVTHAR